MPGRPVSVAEPVATSANAGELPAASGSETTRPNAGLVTVTAGPPAPADTVAVTFAAPIVVVVVVPSSCETSSAVAAASEASPATVIEGPPRVSVSVPCPAVWLASAYVPDTAPKAAVRGAVEMVAEAALTVIVALNVALAPVPVVDVTWNVSDGAAISTTPPTTRSPGGKGGSPGIAWE